MKVHSDKLQSSVVGTDEVTRGLASAHESGYDRGGGAHPVR